MGEVKLDVQSMQQAIRKERERRAMECLEVIREVVEEYNCMLYAVPDLIPTPNGTYELAARVVVKVVEE